MPSSRQEVLIQWGQYQQLVQLPSPVRVGDPEWEHQAGKTISQAIVDLAQDVNESVEAAG